MAMYRRRRRSSRRTYARGYRRRSTSSYGRRRMSSYSRRRVSRRRRGARRQTVRVVLQVAGVPGGLAAASPVSLGQKTNRIVRARY